MQPVIALPSTSESSPATYTAAPCGCAPVVETKPDRVQRRTTSPVAADVPCTPTVVAEPPGHVRPTTRPFGAVNLITASVTAVVGSRVQPHIRRVTLADLTTRLLFVATLPPGKTTVQLPPAVRSSSRALIASPLATALFVGRTGSGRLAAKIVVVRLLLTTESGDCDSGCRPVASSVPTPFAAPFWENGIPIVSASSIALASSSAVTRYLRSPITHLPRTDYLAASACPQTQRWATCPAGCSATGAPETRMRRHG